MIERYVVDLTEVDRSQVALVGGKGANLGELARIDGIAVPDGVCVTTDAFRRIVTTTPLLDELLEELSHLGPDDGEATRVLAAEIRRTLDEVAMPDDLAVAITNSIGRFGERTAFAVRSSATAEDLPTASFAGQHDTYLNVVGGAAILRHVSQCWASLFSERAVAYRRHIGIDHRSVHMAVVVQQMVVPRAAGILFTADPVTSNRRTTYVEATFGLGEALVAGLVKADVFRVRADEVVAKTIAGKRRAVVAAAAGGTREMSIEPDRQEQPALTDSEAVRLAHLGRRIETHFGLPQDIEWCLVGEAFHFVQSRPISTLFPVPAASDDDNHLYVSVGHQQMMTDAMRPLGLSMWQLTAARSMVHAGGRLFVDVSKELASPRMRAGLLRVLGRSDPLIGDALQTIVDREFIPTRPDEGSPRMPAWETPDAIETDPTIVAELVEQDRASLATLQRDIRGRSGSALLDFILADVQELKRVLFDPRSLQVIMAAMTAMGTLTEQLEAWLGDKSAADVLTQSVPGNVTSEMGLALLDVADVIRPHHDVVAFLRHGADESFLDKLPALDGGREAREAILSYLDTYGMRCVGEIDITRPRWSERPSLLVPTLLGNIENAEPGAAGRRFEQGRQQAEDAERDVLDRLRALPDGEEKAKGAKQLIDRIRTFAGYREYPKYEMISRYFVYKQALCDEAGRLVRAHVLDEEEDIFYLTVHELHDVVRTKRVDGGIIAGRKEAFRAYQRLTPPRVLTSDGETITGSYGRLDVPADALVGLPVSSGIVEGRARVVLDMAHADLGADDILVTAYTDPSWTAVFPTIKGLVTEVGGLMTHGAVIAREYGLPAVVGVEQATRLILDGQQIRVDGTKGYIEMLS